MGTENARCEKDGLSTPPPVIPLPPPPPFSEELDSLFTSVDQTSDPEDDPLFDNVAEPGVCGLRNLGNTCFMSAGVQCLVATPPLAKVLMDKSTVATASSHHTLTLQLVELTKQMWCGRFASLQPLNFRNALATLYPQFNDYRQHDCQEFLALLLDGLHEQMNKAVSKDFACQVEPREFKDADHKEASTSNTYQSEPAGNKLNEVQSSVLCEPLVKRLHKGASNMGRRSSNNPAAPDTTQEQLSQAMNNTPGRNFVRAALAKQIVLRADKMIEACDPVQRECHGDGPLLPDFNNKSLTPSLSDVNGLCVLNNAVTRISGLEVFLKEAKTPNVNVLAMEEDANNELRFDSEKYPRIDNIRCKENFNFNYFHDDNDKCPTSNPKRCKKTTGHSSPTSELKDGLDLKRVKLYCSDEEDPMQSSPSSWKEEKNKRMELERRSKTDFDSNLLEKNCRVEYERKKQQQLMDTESQFDTYKEMMGVGTSGLSSVLGETSSSENQMGETEAEKHWQQHLAANRSIIVDTFQGQFKSTVVCSICKFVSVTYEPFMYLSVPLPNALKKQICVTYVGKGGTEVVELTVEVKRHDNIGRVKEQILTTVGDIKGNIVMGEVLNHHIAKILDESHLVRDLNGINRSLYSFEIVTLCEEMAQETMDDIKDNETTAEVESSCTICLEDKEVNMRQHVGCTCILCDICVTASCQHQGSEFLECPVCRKVVNPEVDLTPLPPPSKVATRMIYVPVVFRVDEVGDGNNNQKTVGLFGHPILLRLPNRFSAEALHSALSKLVIYQQPYKILIVDGQGTHCARCMYHSHCPGCQVPCEGNVTLYSSDTLAITFSSPIQELVKPVAHSTRISLRPQKPLSLYDCIQAFSQSEQLDEQNPWFCPHCRKNQCATKTLSIWRYPDYLIVYLKRFIFYDRVSTKLEDKVMFPLEGLNLASTIPFYDLYACVCHIGGISAGHYTSYTQHPNTKEWHYFNDSFVSKQAPQDEDYSSAYILFYKKRGLLSQSLEIEMDSSSFSDVV